MKIDKALALTCDECEWDADWNCPADGKNLCGRHRFVHYIHNRTTPDDPSKITKGKK